MNAYTAAWFSVSSKDSVSPQGSWSMRPEEGLAQGRRARLVLTDQVLLLYPPQLARSFQLPRRMSSTRAALQAPANLPATAKIGQTLQLQLP